MGIDSSGAPIMMTNNDGLYNNSNGGPGGSGAVYALNFLSGVLDPSLTFTRASSATYFNSVGILTSAANNVPRFDYNPSTLALNGLLIEQQSTNLLLQSNNFGTAWTTGNSATITATSGISPDGTNNAWLLNDASNFGFIQQVLTVSSGANYTASGFFKAGSTNSVRLSYRDSTSVNGIRLAINLLNGTAVTSAFGNGVVVAGSVQSLGNGWYRVQITGSITPTNGTVGVEDPNNAAINILVYGVQLEANTFATSYIPTTTATVTRAEDFLTNTTISGWFNPTAGTLFSEAMVEANPSFNARVTIFDDSTSANYIGEFIVPGFAIEAVITISSTANVATTTVAVTSANTPFKIGLGYTSGANLMAVNGTAYSGAAFNTSALPTGLNTLRFGEVAGSGRNLNGWLRSFTYYNIQLTSAQITTISGQL